MSKVLKMIMLVAILSGFLCMANAVNAAAATILNEDNCEYEVDEVGDIRILKCDETLSGDVEIPDMIDECAVVSIGDKAFENCTDIESVTIPESVCYIGESVFLNCTSLTEFAVDENNLYYTVQGGVLFEETDLYGISLKAYPAAKSLEYYAVPNETVKISENAFAYSLYLERVSIPESIEEIGSGAFAGCESLGTILTNEQNLYYTSVNGILYSGDESILHTYPAGKTAQNFLVPDGTEEICDKAFSGCGNLESVTLPQSVISIGDFAFYNCILLENINTGTGIEKIGINAFLGTTWYENQTRTNGALYLNNYLIDFDKTVTGIYNVADGTKVIADSAFEGSALTEINIPEGITRVSCAFKNCAALKKVTIGYLPEVIEASAFSSCVELESIYLPSSLTEIGENAFLNCTELTDIHYEKGEEEWNSINIASGNDCLENAEINYYSTTAPELQPYTSTELVVEGMYVITPYNIPVGSSIIFACYNDEALVYSENFNNDNTAKTVDVSEILYDEIRVFMWESLTSIRPLGSFEPVEQ